MEPKRDIAIVLRAIAYEERHKIVTALTEQNGLVTAMARNAIQSRRFGGALDLFAASDWQFTQKPGAELVHLSEAITRRAFEGIRKDFERLSMAGAFNELMLKLAPQGEPCPDLFRLHSNALAALDEATTTESDFSLLNGYLAKLLQWSGSQPQLQACLQCGLPLEQLSPEAALTCIVADAAWICPSCRTSENRHVREREGRSFHHSLLRVTPAAIQDLYLSLTLPIRQVPQASQASRREHQELFRFLEALFVYHLPGFDQKPLKSLRFLDLESTLPQPAASQR